MKKILVILFSALAIGVFAKEVIVPAFEWSETTYDFGKIKQGVPVTHSFSFRNTGDAPLLVSNVKTPCGCTVTEYTKDPIAPGGEGYITATYNAANIGVFNKTVSVMSNSNESAVVLIIRGEVLESLQ